MKKQTLLIPALSGLLLSSLALSNQVHADNLILTDATTTTAVSSETAPVTTATSLETTSPSTVTETSDQPVAVSEPEVAASATNDEVTILHTNDIHGRIEEERNVIGVAKLATAVAEARAQGTTLVLDAGDAFQGLPISNSTKGEDMAGILNEIGYDAMAVGNHEFDFSLDQAAKYKELLNFPLLSANTYVNGARLFEASTVVDKTPEVAGDEFVVIGVTTPETSTKTHPNNVLGVTFADPVTEVNKVIEQIEAAAATEGKSYKRYIILAHLGIDTTTPVEWQGSTLAKALSENALLKDKTVIVIDGHSHTVETATYGNVTYNQTGSYLNNIGKISLNSTGVLSAGVITTAEGKALTADTTIAAKVAEIKARYQAENAVVVIDNNPVELNGDRSNVRVRETNLGNVVADALWNYGQTGFANKTNLAVTNGGGLRATVAKDAPVTKGDIIAVLPFGNIISQITVSGQNIQDMFVKALGATLQVDKTTGQSVLDDNGQPLLEASGGFLHVSGAKVYYDTTLEGAARILSIQIYDHETNAYLPLDLTKTYYLATNDFLAAGGDGYTMLGGSREEGPSMDSVFADFLKTADLTAYATINPNSRLLSVNAKLDTDKDGFADYLEIILDTNPNSDQDYPGRTFVPKVAPTIADKPIFPLSALKTETKLTSTDLTTVRQQLTKAPAANPASAEKIPVAYKASGDKTLPATGDQGSLALLAVGFGLLAYAGYGIKRQTYGK